MFSQKDKKKSHHFKSALASPKQLAKIAALDRKIRRAQSQLTRVDSLLITTLLIPPLVKLVLLNEQSPFFEIYKNTHDLETNKLKEQILAEVNHHSLEMTY